MTANTELTLRFKSKVEQLINKLETTDNPVEEKEIKSFLTGIVNYIENKR